MAGETSVREIEEEEEEGEEVSWWYWVVTKEERGGGRHRSCDVALGFKIFVNEKDKHFIVCLEWENISRKHLSYCVG